MSLTIDDYFSQVKSIHEQLMAIAIDTAHLANGGVVDTQTNEHFRNAMQTHSILCKQLAVLDKDFQLSQNKRKKD